MSAPELTNAELEALTIHDLQLEGIILASVGAKLAVFRVTEQREDSERVELVAVLNYAPVVQAEVARSVGAVLNHVGRREGTKPTRFEVERDADGRTLAMVPKFDARDL